LLNIKTKVENIENLRIGLNETTYSPTYNKIHNKMASVLPTNNTLVWLKISPTHVLGPYKHTY
jgi:hypothetical protein